MVTHNGLNTGEWFDTIIFNGSLNLFIIHLERDSRPSLLGFLRSDQDDDVLSTCYCQMTNKAEIEDVWLAVRRQVQHDNKQLFKSLLSWTRGKPAPPFENVHMQADRYTNVEDCYEKISKLL